MGDGRLECALSEEDAAKIRHRLSRLFDRMMKVLFRQQGAEMKVEIMMEKPVQDFMEAHATALDQSMKEVTMSELMRRRLQESNYVFSGMKTFHELREAFPSLLDENGVRKTFERFLNDVRKVDETYNSHYLRAEYNFVHASASMAGKWEQFMEDGDRYNLQYRTVGDGKVRPTHAALHNVTLPPSDPFWDEYYPPNGWNCRCTVVQVMKGKYPETPHDEAMKLGELALQDDRKGMFRFNPGKQGKSVPDYNPYTIRRCRDCDIAKGNLKLAKTFIPDNELCEACKVIREMKAKLKQRIEQNGKIYNQLINDPNYTDVHFNKNNGGLKATHIKHNLDRQKGWYEKAVQDVGYKSGHSVILEEEIQNVYRQKSCEGIFDGKPFEIAGAETGTSNNIRNALKHCASKKETKIAVIFFPNGTFSTNAFNDAIAKFNGLKGTTQYLKFDLIYCIQDDKIVQIKKPD